MTDKCCKTCKHWDRDKAKDKAGRIRSDRVAPCLYPRTKLPEAMIEYGRIYFKRMSADDGKNCEVHEKL